MNTLSTLALSVAMAAAAGLVGSFAVMRRMALASDAISHVALPGIGIALAFGVHPLIGGMAMLLLGTLLIWTLERRTKVATETIIGVVFSTALAVGSMLTTGEDLIDALLGAPLELTRAELVLGLGGAGLVIAFILGRRHELVLALVSSDIARTSGIEVDRLNLYYLLAFALTVGLGLRYLGVLLMGSLIIIPAATGKLLAKSLSGMLAIAVVVSLFSTLAGQYLATLLHRQTGPVIISIAAFVFLVASIGKRR
jgi:ABC-type Mn2+/Zn2+ transport system permease subunit